MKRILSLFLAATLIFSCSSVLAEKQWYEETSLRLCERIVHLAGQPQYISLFTADPSVTEAVLPHLQSLKGRVPSSITVYRYKGLTENLSPLLNELPLGEFDSVCMEELNKRLSGSAMASFLNGRNSIDWVAAASILNAYETFTMPEAFVPLLVVVRYSDSEAAFMVSYTQTGETTITANAVIVSASILSQPESADLISLLWEPIP